jgi:predicted enzyme related to lactoylglutathione lyase
MKTNTVAWFEIPVTDLTRAKIFYNKVFEIDIQVTDFGGVQMGWFPDAGQVPGATGSLVQHETYVPSHKGSLVYFSSDDVQIELDRIEAAGGKILQPKTQISPEHGYMGVFEDSEGNRVALHSSK